MSYTTKIFYSKDNTCLSQYSNGLSGYGSRWLLKIKHEGQFMQLVGLPKVKQVNIALTEKFLAKCNDSNDFLLKL
jgi:hypothetical protein